MRAIVTLVWTCKLGNLTVLERLLVPVDEGDVAFIAIARRHAKHSLNFRTSLQHAGVEGIATNLAQTRAFRGSKILRDHALQVVELFLILLLGRGYLRLRSITAQLVTRVVTREVLSLGEIRGVHWEEPVWLLNRLI